MEIANASRVHDGMELRGNKDRDSMNRLPYCTRGLKYLVIQPLRAMKHRRNLSHRVHIDSAKNVRQVARVSPVFLKGWIYFYFFFFNLSE